MRAMLLRSLRACGRGCGAAWLLAGCISESPFEILPPLDSLPADLAAISFTTEGRLSAPYVMVELRHSNGFNGFVALNGHGQPVWFYRTMASPFSFTRRSNGNVVMLDSQRGLVEVTPDGTVVEELAQEPRPGRRMHHDITATDRNTVLFIAEEWRDWNGQPLNGEAIWEWTPETGAVERRWNAFDFLDPAVDRGARSVPGDWLHANSISIGPRGNIILSLHFLNQVLSISPDFQVIEWRLGGVRATLPVDDPFSGQHTAVELPQGHVLLFDNGYERTVERYSRAAEYEITGNQVRRVWEWRPARDNWARVISSARRMPNGNTLVGFGTARDTVLGSTGPVEAYEVSREGDVLWHLTVGNGVRSMYRATPVFAF